MRSICVAELLTVNDIVIKFTRFVVYDRDMTR